MVGFGPLQKGGAAPPFPELLLELKTPYLIESHSDAFGGTLALHALQENLATEPGEACVFLWAMVKGPNKHDC